MQSLAPDRRLGTFLRWMTTLITALFVLALIVTWFGTHSWRFDQHNDLRIGLDGIEFTHHDRTTWTRRLPEGYRRNPRQELEFDDFISDGNGWPGDLIWFVRIPWTYFLLMFGVPAAVLWVWRVRFQRPGVCCHCGYDLTGARLNRRGMLVCPECGTGQGLRSR